MLNKRSLLIALFLGMIALTAMAESEEEEKKEEEAKEEEEEKKRDEGEEEDSEEKESERSPGLLDSVGRILRRNYEEKPNEEASYQEERHVV